MTDTPDPAVVAAIARSLGRRGCGWIETVEKIHIIFQEKILNTPINTPCELPKLERFAKEKGFTLRTVACIGWAEGHETRGEQAAAEARAKLRALRTDVGRALNEISRPLMGSVAIPCLSPDAVIAGASYIAAATVGERLRKAPTRIDYPWTLDTLARAVADASIAWARMTGDCHFCDMNEKDHELDCVLLPYELAKLDAEDPENKKEA